MGRLWGASKSGPAVQGRVSQLPRQRLEGGGLLGVLSHVSYLLSKGSFPLAQRQISLSNQNENGRQNGKTFKKKKKKHTSEFVS